MSAVLEEIMQKDLRKAEEKGTIKGSIKVYYDDLHLSPKEIMKKIMEKYTLQEKEAKEYVENTLEVSLA